MTLLVGRKKQIVYAIGLVLGLLVVYSIAGRVSRHASPEIYTQVDQDKTVEVRNYKNILVAQVTLQGDRADTLAQGVEIIGAFFEGKNSFNKKMDMYAPVFQQQDPTVPGNWTVSMLMPEDIKQADLPIPGDDRIKMIQQPAQNYAILTFNGSHSDGNLDEHVQALYGHLKQSRYIPNSPIKYAYYDCSWSLPYFRKIEALTYVPDDFRLNKN